MGTAALSSVNPSLSIPADALKNASKRSPCAWKTKTKWPCQADHGQSALPVGGGSHLPGHRAGGCSGRGPRSPGCVTGIGVGVGLKWLRFPERIFRLMRGAKPPRSSEADGAGMIRRLLVRVRMDPMMPLLADIGRRPGCAIGP